MTGQGCFTLGELEIDWKERTMNKTLWLLATVSTLATSQCFAAETNIVAAAGRADIGTNGLSALTKEGREARKQMATKRFDLDNNGKLDPAERSLLHNDLKSKIDPVRKRVYVPKPGRQALQIPPAVPKP